MPQGNGKYSDEFKAEFVARRVRGEFHVDACKAMGINLKTGQNWWGEYKRLLYRNSGNLPAPKTKAQIGRSAMARRCLQDFAYFRRIVFGRTTPPWALAAAHEIKRMVDSKGREFAVFNVYPGIGKTLLMQDICCWLIAQNRTIRIIWGSAEDSLAVRRVNDIRIELTRTVPGEGNEDDLSSGRAVKPQRCMAELFGRFRPSSHFGVTWKKDEFTVAQPGNNGEEEGAPASGPTLAAYGRRAMKPGPRAELIIWDDAWTTDENENPELGKKTKRWFDNTAAERLQPQGALVVVMQRLGPDDLSRYCLDKRMPTVDAEGREVGWEPEYRHIVFPAHHDDLCDGTHPEGRAAWDPTNPTMGHCLTDPLALPPREYLRKRGNRNFPILYQQRDMDPVSALIREVYLTGGKDEDGFVYKGCLDYERGLWELPDGVPKSQLACAVAIDVGQEGYWGLVCSVHSTLPDSELEWILTAEHRRMPAGTENGLLDWDFEAHRFVGVLEEWWQRANDLGVPFPVVIAEINAAQRHLFRKMNVLDRWCMSRKVRILQHNTTRNKLDKKLGIEALVPTRFQLGAYRIPWRPGEAQNTMRDLYNEAKNYQQPGWKGDDILLALWMRTLHKSKITRPAIAIPNKEVKEWIKRYA